MTLKNLFKPNDWIPVWSRSNTKLYDACTYNKYTNQTINENQIEITCMYVIEYSKSRNAYRHKCSGYNCERWPEYSEMCVELGKLCK